MSETTQHRKGIGIVAAFVTVAAFAGGPDRVYYVDAAAPPGGVGSSWMTPFRYLQDALNAADAQPFESFIEIRVAQGIYTPDRDASGTRTPLDREVTFKLEGKRTLLGGFRGPYTSGIDPDERIPFVTRLSGDLLADDQPDFVNRMDNSEQVVSTRFGPVVIDGFVIEDGNRDVEPVGDINCIVELLTGP